MSDIVERLRDPNRFWQVKTADLRALADLVEAALADVVDRPSSHSPGVFAALERLGVVRWNDSGPERIERLDGEEGGG